MIPVRRLATHDDVAAIEDVMRASIRVLGARFYDARQVESAIRYIAIADRALIDDGTYYIVDDGSRVAACGGWSRRKKLFTGSEDQESEVAMLDPGSDPARIRAMFVHPDYARRGLGRLILDASEKAAIDAGFSCFELMATLPGVPLYETCGYTATSRTTIDFPDGVHLESVRMSRCVK